MRLWAGHIKCAPKGQDSWLLLTGGLPLCAYSAFRILHSAFRILHSAFRIPHSAFCIPNS